MNNNSMEVWEGRLECGEFLVGVRAENIGQARAGFATPDRAVPDRRPGVG